MGKPKGKRSTGQTPAGARVARERAARRRAAKQRALSEQQPAAGSLEAEALSTEPALVEIPHSDLMNEMSVLATLIAAGLARHHPEARRLFRDEGVQVNDEPVLSDKAKLRLSDVTAAGTIKLSVGRSRRLLLKPV